MFLLKSLLCREGRDSPIRFAIISALAFVSYLLIMAIVSGSDSLFTSLLVILIIGSVIGLTTIGWIRRINDIGRPGYWSVVPAVFWLQFCLVHWIWPSTTLALSSTAALVLISVPGMLVPASDRVGKYGPGKQGVAGYTGPQQKRKNHTRRRMPASDKSIHRVEPSLNKNGDSEQQYFVPNQSGFGDWDTLPVKQHAW